MDYTKQPLAVRVRKVLRYLKLYGLRYTVSKVRGQYHMRKRYSVLPQRRERMSARSHVGIIGCGSFAFSTIAYFLRKNFGRVIRAAMDVDVNRAASLFERYGLDYYTEDADELLADPAIDLVFIASDHASHAECAVKALEAGKSVHVEKPHVVNDEQLVRLCRAMSVSEGKVALGFNFPHSPISRRLKAFLDEQPGPAVCSLFMVGHDLPADHWYFADGQGGRVLGNLCHWTDYVLLLVSPEARYPITIRPTHVSESDCAATYAFGDGSVAAIVLSARGATFEGVRVRFSAQRGDAIAFMDDLRRLMVDIGPERHRMCGLRRKLGHEEEIVRSYRMVRPRGEELPGAAVDYVWETGQLFLRTQEALETGRVIELQPFDRSILA